MSYEDFVEGIKPELSSNNKEAKLRYKIEDGIFKRMCVEAAYEYVKLHSGEGQMDSSTLDYEHKRDDFERIKWSEIDPRAEVPKYLLIIDEINRGNIASILGELITLLEEDKRGGKEESIAVTLPYSKSTFAVPPNLYLIGTMNTADRSVEALDSALRRRFSFREMLPRPDLLEEISISGLKLDQLLHTINRRIEKLIDKDHTIGHAYFLHLKDVEHPWQELRTVFQNKIIPLLQEYFFGNFGKLELVIGEDFFEAIEEEGGNPSFFAKANYDADELIGRPVYRLKDWLAKNENGAWTHEEDSFRTSVIRIIDPEYGQA